LDIYQESLHDAGQPNVKFRILLVSLLEGT